ncbi:UrcA family protein [Sphingomonas sp. AP4-R1]|uniref:UrcA family protein n=1 Tax=Sphingomonas sp. AP4-R1 TaxID=2735134 RepID=UPI001493475C|nr:UrcA family protein [Sphingomonas sp. AP4-R1]QJU59076.1 UrcA family protein [Sphingomonas sp. AP4-R1]
MMRKLWKWTWPSLVIAGSILSGAPAFAQTATRHVAYDDINLASAAGQARLRHRLDSAVTAVCGEQAALTMLSVAHAVQRCRADARQDAQMQLSAMYNGSQKLAAKGRDLVVASR